HRQAKRDCREDRRQFTPTGGVAPRARAKPQATDHARLVRRMHIGDGGRHRIRDDIARSSFADNPGAMIEPGRKWDAIMLVLIIGLPVIGAGVAGENLARFREFPPTLDIPTGYPRFSWIAAALVLAAVVFVLSPLWTRSKGERA